MFFTSLEDPFFVHCLTFHHILCSVPHLLLGDKTPGSGGGGHLRVQAMRVQDVPRSRAQARPETKGGRKSTKRVTMATCTYPIKSSHMQSTYSSGQYKYGIFPTGMQEPSWTVMQNKVPTSRKYQKYVISRCWFSTGIKTCTSDITIQGGVICTEFQKWL